MNRLRRHLLLAPLAAATAVRAQPAPCRIALAPFLSPAALLATFRPLREHLQRRLPMPVEMITARDFRTLVDATQRGEHEVAQLPAHLARLAMRDWGWTPLPSPTERVAVIVGVAASGPVRAPADLRGRAVGMLDPLSLTATIGRRWLEREGLQAATSVTTVPSVNAALHALSRGEIAAFVAADTQLATLPPTTPRGERVLASVADIPGPQYLARPQLPAAEVAALRDAMLSFEPDPARPTTAANSALRSTDPARLAALDDYVASAREALRTGVSR